MANPLWTPEALRAANFSPTAGYGDDEERSYGFSAGDTMVETIPLVGASQTKVPPGLLLDTGVADTGLYAVGEQGAAGSGPYLFGFHERGTIAEVSWFVPELLHQDEFSKVGILVGLYDGGGSFNSQPGTTALVAAWAELHATDARWCVATQSGDDAQTVVQNQSWVRTESGYPRPAALQRFRLGVSWRYIDNQYAHGLVNGQIFGGIAEGGMVDTEMWPDFVNHPGACGVSVFAQSGHHAAARTKAVFWNLRIRQRPL